MQAAVFLVQMVQDGPHLNDVAVLHGSHQAAFPLDGVVVFHLRLRIHDGAVSRVGLQRFGRRLIRRADARQPAAGSADKGAALDVLLGQGGMHGFGDGHQRVAVGHGGKFNDDGGVAVHLLDQLAVVLLFAEFFDDVL